MIDDERWNDVVAKAKAGKLDNLLRPIGVPEGEKIMVEETFDPDGDEGGVPLSERTLRDLLDSPVRTDDENVQEHATPVAMARGVRGHAIVVCDDGSAFQLTAHGEWEPLPPVPGSRIWSILEDPPNE